MRHKISVKTILFLVVIFLIQCSNKKDEWMRRELVAKNISGVWVNTENADTVLYYFEELENSNELIGFSSRDFTITNGGFTIPHPSHDGMKIVRTNGELFLCSIQFVDEIHEEQIVFLSEEKVRFEDREMRKIMEIIFTSSELPKRDQPK
ncbi:hypothetical protein [Fulvivirga sp.]|uniref:hypothetical protein n=1 Tax=Fulvivirga sp. TaxID=1931237 RepID=UPI0032EBE3F9